MSEEGLEKTPHKKIFIGKPGNFDINELKKSIAELLMISINGNEYLIKQKMKEIVPTYLEINEELDAKKEVAITL